MVAGLGVLVVCFLPPLVGFTRRIELEERALARELGTPYRDYQARTSKLLPGIW